MTNCRRLLIQSVKQTYREQDKGLHLQYNVSEERGWPLSGNKKKRSKRGTVKPNYNRFNRLTEMYDAQRLDLHGDNNFIRLRNGSFGAQPSLSWPNHSTALAASSKRFVIEKISYRNDYSSMHNYLYMLQRFRLRSAVNRRHRSKQCPTNVL